MKEFRHVPEPVGICIPPRPDSEFRKLTSAAAGTTYLFVATVC